MKLNRINGINFKGKIIDSHAHIGNWEGKRYEIEHLDVFCKQPLSNGDVVEKMLISNLSCIEEKGMLDEIAGNMEILDSIKNDSKYIPLAVCQPKTGSVENIKKLFSENPDSFVGLKFHPDGHKIFASDKLFDPYLRFAQSKKLPCLFHCGINWENGELVDYTKRFSSPRQVYAAACKIPDTPVVMAHLGSGGQEVHRDAIDILIDSIKTGRAKLFADISWVDIDNPKKPTIIALIRRLKATSKGDKVDRILFGSDGPIGEFTTGKNGLSGIQLYEKIISDTKKAIKTNFGDEADEIIDKIFYKNAENLFLGDKTAKNVVHVIQDNVENTVKESVENVKPKGFTGLIVAGVVAVGAGIFYYCKKNNIFVPKNNQVK